MGLRRVEALASEPRIRRTLGHATRLGDIRHHLHEQLGMLAGERHSHVLGDDFLTGLITIVAMLVVMAAMDGTGRPAHGARRRHRCTQSKYTATTHAPATTTQYVVVTARYHGRSRWPRSS